MKPPSAWPRHVIMIVVSILMLIPFYWVLKTSLTGENIYAYPPRIIPADPHLFNYVDVWYLIPFPRYLLNSVIVSAMAIAGSLRRDEDGERLQVCGLQLSHVREIGEECLQARLQFLQPALG